jgi:oligopeptide/dipeptide ABC transporter ATP-binding protein
MNDGSLLDVRNLKKYFPIISGLRLRVTGYIYAIDGVSFQVQKNETFGLVGESGCGKTTIARVILGLEEPTSGSILFDGVDLSALDKGKLRETRRNIQTVFQDPYSSLHPRKTVKDIVSEPLKIHFKLSEKTVREKTLDIIRKVGLSEEHLSRYPHEFSGGQRQRIAIARALILEPKFLILDEPTSALDVSVQATILNLLKKLQREFNLSYLMISHNLTILEYMSKRTAVMYLGKIMEFGETAAIFNDPIHPYTVALLSSNPSRDSSPSQKKILLKGEIPSNRVQAKGCPFYNRCWLASSLPGDQAQKCIHEEPPLITAKDNHSVACHYWEQVQDRSTEIITHAG